MARYIDAEVAETLLNKAQSTEDDDYFLGLCAAESIIHYLPEADVAPVVHAKWIKTKIEPYNRQCSNCKSNFRALYDYCPHCGAKMDEWSE